MCMLGADWVDGRGSRRFSSSAGWPWTRRRWPCSPRHRRHCLLVSLPAGAIVARLPGRILMPVCGGVHLLGFGLVALQPRPARLSTARESWI
jgi:hypothetical protein